MKSDRTVLISKTLDALALDESTAHFRTDEYKSKVLSEQKANDMESERARALANALVESIEENGDETVKISEKAKE